MFMILSYDINQVAKVDTTRPLLANSRMPMIQIDDFCLERAFFVRLIQSGKGCRIASLCGRRGSLFILNLNPGWILSLQPCQQHWRVILTVSLNVAHYGFILAQHILYAHCGRLT